MMLLEGKNWMECPSCEIEQHGCHVDDNASGKSMTQILIRFLISSEFLT